jgi:hypothetical protein
MKAGMNKEQATALCLQLAEEAWSALSLEIEEELRTVSSTTDAGLVQVDVVEDRDGGSSPFVSFAVVPNNNPSGVESFAVIQWEPDSGDTWLHVAHDVCFDAQLFNQR